MKVVGIYKITSPTGAIYIGQSNNIWKRMGDYKRISCKKLYNSILSHGWEAHKFEICHELPKDVTKNILNEYERLYWNLYKDCGIEMMNLKEPGIDGALSEEAKEKQRVRMKIWALTNSGKDSQYYGIPRSEETKQKIREANRIRKENGWVSPFSIAISQYDLEGNIIATHTGLSAVKGFSVE